MIKQNTFLFALCLLALSSALPSSVCGFRQIRVPDNSTLALGGYDPVVYYAEEKAVMGKAEYSTIWKDVEWHFVSPLTRSLFIKHPEMFAPQFGGYCALGLEEKTLTSDVDPRSFVVYRNKVYFFHDKTLLNKWNEDPAKYIAIAEKRWETLIAQGKVSPTEQ